MVPFIDVDHFISKKEFLQYLQSDFEKTYIIKYDPEKKRQAKREYWNIPASFDIETTSFLTPEGEKCATMYLWAFNLNGRSIYGRTWEEFLSLMELLHDVLNTEYVHLIIWCHNLAYEFNWMRKWLDWKEVFCLHDHEAARAETTTGIEFRCSLLESGKKLALLAEEIRENPIRKLDTLKYEGMRHSGTPLTDLELMYQLNDVRIVSNYIYEKGKKRGKIPRILMTKTGYVRELYRKNTIANEDRNTRQHYRGWMEELTMEPEEYLQAEKTYQGAFVHANYLYVGDTLDHVGSLDKISDYPSQCTHEFPMSKGELFRDVEADSLKGWFPNFCCMFRWEAWNLKRRKGVFDDPISESHCEELERPVINNGRVKQADHLVMWITEVDYEIYTWFYEWTEERFSQCWRYRKGFLPKPFIETMLQLYEEKTKLKGVVDMEELYLLSKENLNSSYLRDDGDETDPATDPVYRPGVSDRGPGPGGGDREVQQVQKAVFVLLVGNLDHVLQPLFHSEDLRDRMREGLRLLRHGLRKDHRPGEASGSLRGV